MTITTEHAYAHLGHDADAYVSAHLPAQVADDYLIQQGWRVEDGPSSDDEGTRCYVVPGGKSWDEDGRYTVDYYWGPEQALKVAITTATLRVPVEAALADLGSILLSEQVTEASVSEPYRTGDWWRVTVAVNGIHALQPRFRSEAQALAYREGAGEMLDGAT